MALADLAHFGEAADFLHLTQSALSQQIAKAEAEVGAPLFERGYGRTVPTQAGAEYVARARDVLARVDAMEVSVQDVALNGPNRLRVGLFGKGAAELTPVILRTFRQRYPRVRLTTAQLSMPERSTALLEDEIDLVIAPQPIEHSALTYRPLFREPRIVAMEHGHRLAKNRSVHVDDLLDERFVRKGGSEAWSAFWSCDPQRGGPARDAGLVTTIEDAQARVAYDGAVSTGPASTGRLYRQPGVVHRPVSGVAPVLIAVERRRDDELEAALAFEEIAVRVVAAGLDSVPGATPAH